MFIEYVELEVGWYRQIQLMRCRVHYRRYGMALRLVEEIDVHHLLPVCCIPDMELLLVVWDKRTDILIVEDILHLPTCSMLCVRTCEFMPKLQSLWQHRPIHLRLRPHQLTYMINLLADASHLTDRLLLATSFRLSYLLLFNQLRPLWRLFFCFSLMSISLVTMSFCSYPILLIHDCCLWDLYYF